MPMDYKQTEEQIAQDEMAENVLTGKVKKAATPPKVDIKLSNAARKSLVNADVSWRIGRYMDEKGYDGVNDTNYGDLFNTAKDLFKGKRDDETINNVILNAKVAYDDPNAVLTWNGNTFQWQNKDIAEENGHPYVYTVKQAINAIADQNKTSYSKVAMDIAPNGYYKNFGEYKKTFDFVDKAKNTLLGSIGLDRLGEVYDDPQLEGKRGAKLRAIAPALAEMTVGEAVPTFIMGRGFKAAKTGKNISNAWDTATKAVKGAGAGAAGGFAAPLAGYAADKSVGGWQADREAPSIGQMAASTGLGAVAGGVAGGVQPLRKDDAAKRLLYKNTRGNADVAEELYPNGFGDVRKELIDAAEDQVPTSDYAYRPMNNPQFQGEKVRTQAMPSRVGREVEKFDNADDELIGQWRDLQSNPLGGKGVGSGRSGMQIIRHKDAPQEATLVAPDTRVAHNWADEYNTLHPDNPIVGDKYIEATKKLLKESQDPASTASQVVGNKWVGTLSDFNKHRGQYAFKPNEDTPDNFMRNYVWKDPVWEGSPEKTDAFNAARKDTHRRKLETAGANGGENGYVGGKNFKKDRAEMQGGGKNWFTKQVAPRAPMFIPLKHPTDMWNEYNLDDWKIPTKH